MFKSWFKKLQKKKPNPYIINEEKTEPASVSVVKRVYTSKGYLTSPYNKNYPATGSLEHKYKPIETITKSASLKEEPKTEIVKQEMVEVKEEIPSKLIEVPTKEIDFYETAKLCGIEGVPIQEVTEEATNPLWDSLEVGTIDERFEQTVESEHPIAVTNEIINDATQTRFIPDEPGVDIVEEKDGHIFVMNGYGVEIKLENKNIIAYIDTGIDVNLKPDQEVILSHWNGKYDKKVGKVIKESGTEREGKSEEVLIQNV